MIALALLVLNHITVIDVARGVALADRAVEIEGARIRAVLAPPAIVLRSAPSSILPIGRPTSIAPHAHNGQNCSRW